MFHAVRWRNDGEWWVKSRIESARKDMVLLYICNMKAKNTQAQPFKSLLYSYSIDAIPFHRYCIYNHPW